jgi:hypothetical protein
LIIKDAEIKGRDLLGESYVEKQRVQQSLTQLKQIEEDFKFKFRSLLEAHISLLSEDAVSGERRGPRSPVPTLESEEESAVEISSPSDDVEYIGLRELPTRADFLQDLEREDAGGKTENEPEGLNELESVEPDLQSPPVAQPEIEVEETPEPQRESHPEGEPEVAGVGEGQGEGAVVDDNIPAKSADERVDAAVGDDAAESGAGQRDSSVRRFLFGRKDKPSDEGDFFDGPEDRDFQW